ncbi:hypothetical protein IR073_03160 [Gemella sp. 19428wG2_WT2a]|nr:hypothetical protein [Gemella sp. 19428wG2_WT2a]TFU59994.1 hypothetical protein E4T67_03135 [Gemella sp. WT2a]
MIKKYLKIILPYFSNLTEHTNATMGKTLNKKDKRYINPPTTTEQKRIVAKFKQIRETIGGFL